MTNRERILALLRGERFDRVPFFEYDEMTPSEEAWELVGRENLGRLRWTSASRIDHPNCSIESEETNAGIRTLRRRLTTPMGVLSEVVQYEPTYGAGSIKEHYIKSLDDYSMLHSYLDDIQVVPDPEPFERTMRELGDDGLPHTTVGRTPYQDLWIDWVDMMDLAHHLVEAPDLINSVMEKLGRLTMKIVDATKESAPPYIVIGDNITAPMIGEKYFRNYCLPWYERIASVMGDIPVVVHMDGDLKPLWNSIAESPIRGLDSFSPTPDNDTSAAEAAEVWPDKILMLNFPSSVHVLDSETIYRTALEILEQAGHTGRLQIQISENVPPGVFRTSYPAIVRAISDFGDPF